MRLPLVVTSALALVLTLGASSALGSDVKITIVSLPEGATVFTDQGNGTEKSWGTGPITLRWEVPNKWNNCFSTETVKVRWISGVEASAPLWVCAEAGKKQQFVFKRPAEIPGIELDVQYAVALMQSAAAERAARRAAILALVPPRQKICTSNIVGNQVFTYCY